MSLPKKLSLRHLALAGALIATLLATWWASQVDETDRAWPAPAARKTMPPVPGGAAPVPPVTAAAAFGRPPWPPKGAELITAPPPVIESPTVPVPMEPAAPPLPFRFIGILDEPGRSSAVVLLNGQDVVTVRTGERIDDQYRVARITPNRIEFIHLPTRQRQALEIADYELQK